MGSSLNYEGLKFEKGSVAKVTDPLAVEQALQININGKSFTVVMQTPGAEKELGFWFALLRRCSQKGFCF
jgi:formate dehydrogenase assembly factor FdhD